MRGNNDYLINNAQERSNSIVYLIARTLLDRQLKTGLMSSIPLKNGNASAVIRVFAVNPLKFT